MVFFSLYRFEKKKKTKRKEIGIKNRKIYMKNIEFCYYNFKNFFFFSKSVKKYVYPKASIN